MDQRVSLITLGVRDLARARAFYEALGWRSGTSDDDVVFFQAGGMILGLWDRALLAEDSGVADAGGWGGVTLAYNVTSPQLVDDTLNDASCAGATIARSGAATFWACIPGCSLTPTGIRGRWLTIPAGPSTRRTYPAAVKVTIPHRGRYDCLLVSN